MAPQKCCLTLISEKDKSAFSVSDWLNDDRSENFVYGKL